MGLCCCGALAPYGHIELPDKIVRIDHTTRAEAIAVAARSFSGTATTDPEGTFDWTMGPQLAGKWDDPRRLKLVSWIMEAYCMMIIDRRGGFALGARKVDGTLGAVVFVTNEATGMSSEIASLFRDVIPTFKAVGFKPLNEMGEAKQGIRARLLSLEVVEKLRRKLQSGPHVYVNIMAVDPDAQGMGFCGLLMRFVNTLADKLKMRLYLETSGPKNESIYKRFGYETIDKFEISCPKDPDQSAPHVDEYAMRRPAAGE